MAMTKTALATKIAEQNKEYKSDLETLSEMLTDDIDIPDEAREILNKYKEDCQ